MRVWSIWGEVVGVRVWECEGKWCEGMEYMG